MPTYTTEIEINDTPVEVVVSYEYEPPCGDGWNEPRLGEDATIYSVTDTSGNEVDYSKDLESFLVEEILEDLHRRAAEYEQDRAEYIYESRIDFLMDR